MNSKTSAPDLSRRKFLGACCASVGATGMLSALAQLRVLGAVADTSTSIPTPRVLAAPQTDFKALVCLFMAGGNDANNLVVPTDAATYAEYATGRGALAISQAALLGITPRTSDGRTWGLHPSLGINPNGTTNGGLKGLYADEIQVTDVGGESGNDGRPITLKARGVYDSVYHALVAQRELRHPDDGEVFVALARAAYAGSPRHQERELVRGYGVRELAHRPLPRSRRRNASALSR